MNDLYYQVDKQNMENHIRWIDQWTDAGQNSTCVLARQSYKVGIGKNLKVTYISIIFLVLSYKLLDSSKQYLTKEYVSILNFVNKL